MLIPFLNYFAFLILYITGFVFIYQKYSEIIGLALLFIVNAAFMMFIAADLFAFTESYSYFIPLIGSFAVLVGCLFHFISLIFIMMMLGNMKTKYENAKGTPLILPKRYADKLELFKRLMISVFSLCAIILTVMFLNTKAINVSFIDEIKYIDLDSLSENFYSILILLASLSVIGISSYQIKEADSFAKLSRQDLIV